MKNHKLSWPFYSFILIDLLVHNIFDQNMCNVKIMLKEYFSIYIYTKIMYRVNIYIIYIYYFLKWLCKFN